MKEGTVKVPIGQYVTVWYCLTSLEDTKTKLVRKIGQLRVNGLAFWEPKDNTQTLKLNTGTQLKIEVILPMKLRQI